ncbi:MAG: type II toxin-antitoxin system VapC family toxin [Caldilineales bacterium]|nr:type II toxin-antitoxin system VapC family toxin [Caldilineales bacterium]MDW8316394.1 type II toxin-antitoxin system VapC family toxin [Anaerolineae bacterium]
MRALLDTHAFLWWITNDPRLTARVQKTVQNPGNLIFLSAASGWELAIKASIGKLHVSQDLDTFISEQLTLNRIDVLPVLMSHALFVRKLPAHHRDPFDRLLVAQSLVEGMPLITSDPLIAKYSVQVIW